MPIDFSKINLSALPKGGNVVKAPPKVVKAPPKKGRIDYGAIKLGNIYTPAKVAPKPAAIPKNAGKGAPITFQGRPLVTPVEQQRMKAATPTPTVVSRLTGEYDPQKYNPEVSPVTPLLQTEAVKRWSAEAAAARKATPAIGQRLLEGMDSFTKIIQPNITPREPGRNTVVDFVGSIASVAAGVYAAKSLLNAIGAGVLYLKTPRSVADRETTTLFPRFDSSFQAQKYVLKLSQTDPAAAERFRGDLTTLLAQTMAKDMPSTLSDESLQKSASLMYDFLVSNGEAGSFATVGERVASVTTAASNLAAAVGNPQMSLAAAEQATNQLAKTGVLQLLAPLTITNRLASIPMPAGIVHSTSPAIPMGGITRPAAATPQIAYNKPITEMTEEEFVNKAWKGYPTAPEGYTLLYHSTPEGNVQSVLENGLRVGTNDVNGSRGIIWGTTVPGDYGAGNAMIVFRVPVGDDTVSPVNATEQTVRRSVPSSDIVQVYHAISGDKGGVSVNTREDLVWLATKAGNPGRAMSYRVASPSFKVSETPVAKVATEPYVPRDKNQVEHLLLERPQPAVPGVKTTKSMDTIMAEEEAAGRKLETTPRAVDKVIPAIDVKKANLVDVTAKVDLKSVQVKFPSADKVVLDTKRRTVMFMHGTTPLEAIAVDKPQLKEWYGIEGAKLLGEITQPAPVVAQVAPTLSKMETPAPTKSIYPAPQEGYTILYHQTNGENVDQIQKEGIKKDRLGATTQSKTGQIWSTRVPSPDVMYGGSMVAFRIPNSDFIYNENHAAAGAFDSDHVKNEVIVLHDIPAKDILRVYHPIESEPLPGIKTYTREDLMAAQLAPDLSTTLKKGTATTISNQKTGISTSTPVSLRGGTDTGAGVQETAIGNAAPAHGLIDYSRIELNGTTSQTSPKVLASVANALHIPGHRYGTVVNGKIVWGKAETKGKGFANYLQNIPGTTKTSTSLATKIQEIRDGYIRFIADEYNWFFKSPLGGEWMAIAVAADDIMLEEYKNPFYIDEAGEQVFVGGEFAPAILARYLKASDVITEHYLKDQNGVDSVAADGKKIPNPYYGKPAFGVFLQHLQRAGISTEPTAGLSAEKEALKQAHIYNARMSLANFQKGMPQLFQTYMAQANELGEANRLLPEFYKGIISPETYANEKANPHYYVSLSAGKTDIFDRSGVAPLEKARGLTNLEEVVPPLEGLISVYVDAIRAQGINNAKREAVKSSKSAEVATTVLSDSIVHLKEDGVDRAYEVHDKDAGASIRNLTRSKWEVPSLVKRLATAPTTLLRTFATGVNIAFGVFNPVRDIIQAAGLVPFTPKGFVKGVGKAFASPGLSQWNKEYLDPTRPTGTKVTEAVKKIVEIVSIPSAVGETLGRRTISESIADRGGTYLDQFYGYHAGTGFFALHGTVFNDFISSLIPFTRATIAVVRAAYRNAFYGLPIGGKGGTFSGKQGAEKIAGKNFLATIIFTIIEMAAIKAAGKEKEYKLLRNRASFFYLYQPSGNWVKLPVPIGSAPVKAIVESLYGYKSDPMDVVGQTLNVIPGLEAFMLPPALTLYLQYKFNINFFTGSPINTGYDTPAKNPLEATIMKLGYTEEQAAMALQSFFADIPSQFQYVFDIVATGSSTQAFPLTKRFIVKDPTTSSNAAVDDFYALVDAAKASKNPALESLVNARASIVSNALHNAKLYPENAKTYIAGATDFIIATFALIAENPDAYGIKKFGPFSWRPSGNYEALAP